jgi:hypothetical protein
MRDAVSVRNVEKEAQINQIETHPTNPSSNSTPIADVACCASMIGPP